MKRKKINIGYRTIKTAIGSGITIFLAQLLGVQNYGTASAITLLSIQSTKRQSFICAVQRFIACILGMIIGSILFEQLGFQPLTVVIYFLFTLPVLVTLGLQEGIVVSSVIILQLYTEEQITLSLLLNQTEMVAVGIGVALIMNLYMPSIENNLQDRIKKIEDNYKFIFITLSIYMKRNEQNIVTDLLLETEQLLQSGKKLAFKESDNSLFNRNNYYYDYFEMREKQFNLIKDRIIPILIDLESTIQQSYMIAEFLEEISLQIYENNTAEALINKLEGLKEQFSEMDLPKSRDEFETRALLLNLVKELENFLHLKNGFKENMR